MGLVAGSVSCVFDTDERVTPRPDSTFLKGQGMLYMLFYFGSRIMSAIDPQAGRIRIPM